MAITTLGDLLHWLLETPRSRLETLRATQATPQDLSAAVSMLVVNNQLYKPTESLGRLHCVRRTSVPGTAWILPRPIAGCRKLYPFLQLHLEEAWIKAGIHEAARIWKKSADRCDDVTEDAVLGEQFLALKLGRVASDSEAVLFWDLVDKPRAGSRVVGSEV